MFCFFFFVSTICENVKKPGDIKKSKEDEQISAGLSWAHLRSQANVSKAVTLNEFKFSSLPYNKYLINRAKSVCMGESWPRSGVQIERSEVCTHDLGQDSPIQTYCPVNKS